MAEYIEKAEIEKWGTCIAKRNDKQELIPKIGLHLLPTADVIECAKIAKTIAEIKELYTEWENSTDDARLESNPFGAVLNIIQRNIGE